MITTILSIVEKKGAAVRVRRPPSAPAFYLHPLYSFMQGSFVKIQDLIGYVSKYMLNAT